MWWTVVVSPPGGSEEDGTGYEKPRRPLEGQGPRRDKRRRPSLLSGSLTFTLLLVIVHYFIAMIVEVITFNFQFIIPLSNKFRNCYVSVAIFYSVILTVFYRNDSIGNHILGKLFIIILSNQFHNFHVKSNSVETYERP